MTPPTTHNPQVPPSLSFASSLLLAPNANARDVTPAVILTVLVRISALDTGSVVVATAQAVLLAHVVHVAGTVAGAGTAHECYADLLWNISFSTGGRIFGG